MEKVTLDSIKWLADSMIDNFPGCILRIAYINEAMELEYVSEGIEKIIGYTADEYRANFSRFAVEHVDPEDIVWGKEFLEEAFRTGKGLRREYAIRGKDGEKRWVEVRSSLVERTEEKIVMQYVMLDIDEQKRAEELAKKEHRRLEVIAELSTDSVFEYDIATDCMGYYNQKEILLDSLRNTPVVKKYTERILNGSILNELFHKEDNQKIKELCYALRNGQPEIYAEVRKQYEKGKYTWVSVEAKTVTDKNGKPSHVIGKISNIDEKIKREQEVKYQLERDQLTGVYNRQTVEKMIAEKLLTGVSTDAYVLLTDVDEFKHLNDEMGYLFGDGVLCTFANYMTELFPNAIIGRTSGDEFMIYLEGLKAEDIQACISRINRRLARIQAGVQDELQVSVSFGVAKCDKGTENSLEDLKYKADVALCFSKQKGRGSIALYEKSMEDRHVHRTERPDRHPGRDSQEMVIQTQGDIMLFAHELFDNIKDIRGALRLLSDVITRFYHFQDIIYIHKQDDKYEMLFHWGDNNTNQFYRSSVEIENEPDWRALLYKNEEREAVVRLEDEFIGPNVNGAKSMLSFGIYDTELIGYCIMVDRKEKRDWKEERSSLIRLGDFIVKRYLNQMEKQRKEEEAEYKSKYDRLTGMMNLSYFTTACDQHVKAYPEKQFAILYTDFTNFKFFNENYGYNEGNKILKEYADFLRDEPGILHSRIAADSFVSLYETEDAEQLRQRFHVRGEQFCEAAHRYYPKCKLGIAGGIALVDRSLQSITLNIDSANMARKSVRKSGTVKVAVYTEALREEQQKQMEIVSHMTEALENKEFRVYLQPKMDMFTDKVIGAEALARWFKKDGTMVSPGAFIPIFEENGFVTQIDFEIMRQVLEMQQKRLQEGKPIVKVSVNFSRKHQENQNYLQRLDELMEQYDVPAKCLEIEITESVFMQDLAPLVESICQLKNRGFSVSIDDFGAGYSSLNVLSKIKADIVKLDRQFLLDVEMEKDNFTSEFLQLLINMIKQLGFKVLAEGVETEAQVKLLKNAGCRFAQGFYYARPMPLEEFLDFLDQHIIEEEE